MDRILELWPKIHPSPFSCFCHSTKEQQQEQKLIKGNDDLVEAWQINVVHCTEVHTWYILLKWVHRLNAPWPNSRERERQRKREHENTFQICPSLSLTPFSLIYREKLFSRYLSGEWIWGSYFSQNANAFGIKCNAQSITYNTLCLRISFVSRLSKNYK